MELSLDNKGCRRFLADLLSNRQNSSFGSADSFLGSMDSNISHVVVVRDLVNVDLGTCIVLNLVDARAAFAKNTGNGTGWDSKLKNVAGLLFELQSLEKFGFGTSHTFLATFDEDFVRLESLASPVFTVFRGTPRECDLDTIFLLETNGVFTVLTNQRSMELGRDLEGF